MATATPTTPNPAPAAHKSTKPTVGSPVTITGKITSVHSFFGNYHVEVELPDKTSVGLVAKPANLIWGS